MMRKSTRKPPGSPPGAKAAGTRLRGKPTRSTPTEDPVIANLKAGIIANWNLSSSNINTCISPERWPLNESDAGKWSKDILQLLHEASESSKRDNEGFQRELSTEIESRQSRSRSEKSKTGCMTVADLRKVSKRLQTVKEGKLEVPERDDPKPDEVKTARRGRSNGKSVQDKQTKYAEEKEDLQTKAAPAPATRIRGRPKNPDPNPSALPPPKPGTKRQASDLPLRPARKLRGGRSPKPTSPRQPIAPKRTHHISPPPITPANPPSASTSTSSPTEVVPPVSGRHIYGDLIKPTTLSFSPPSLSPPSNAPTRPQTRKRARAKSEKSTEVQIDSDPRDIDATGFLSELDPKEARQRRGKRKQRLSRLVQGRVGEPAWSQDMGGGMESVVATPVATPAAMMVTAGKEEEEVLGVSSPPAPALDVNGDEEDAGIDLLFDLLPEIPVAATVEERQMLEDRVALLQRDVEAYRRAVREIREREGE